MREQRRSRRIAMTAEERDAFLVGGANLPCSHL